MVEIRFTNQRVTRLLGAVLCLALGACTNNLISTRINNLTGQGSGNSTGTTSSSPDGGATSILTLTRVVKNAQDPATTLDLIGDGSGQIGQFCQSTSQTGTSSTSGPSTCKCVYSYTNPTAGATEQSEEETTYHELNVIRCKYSTRIPSAVSTVRVKIRVTLNDAYSNEISVKLIGTGVTLDTSSALSFAKAQRYQCRDVVTIRHMMDDRIYDPIQSEDGNISYPLNFYSTNMGSTFSFFASLGGSITSQWNCPPNPNDSSTLASLRVYSVGPDSTGSKVIYPPPGAGGGFDRHTFYLARAASGVFNVPVNAYIAPTLPSSSQTAAGDNVPALGYAAAPIPTAPGMESCPDSSVVIPSGYHWVKIWLFRADLQNRTFVKSNAIANLAITCNPGNYPGGVTPVFPDCANTGNDTYAAGIADRILSTNQCFNLGPAGACPGPGPGCTTQTMSPPTQFGGFTAVQYGSDIWGPTLAAASNYSCGGSANSDPLNLCSQGAAAAPYDPSPVVVDLDGNNPRFDFLFVVTPPTVMAATMRNSSLAANYPYTPYRFYTSSDCSSPDPDNPLTPGDCNPSKAIRYGLKLHDVANNGDPPANDPNRAGVFPVCALQPD